MNISEIDDESSPHFSVVKGFSHVAIFVGLCFSSESYYCVLFMGETIE